MAATGNQWVHGLIYNAVDVNHSNKKRNWHQSHAEPDTLRVSEAMRVQQPDLCQACYYFHNSCVVRTNRFKSQIHAKPYPHGWTQK